MMAVGPLAELAIEKTISSSLRQQLTEARATVNRRADDAYRTGLDHGRASFPLGMLIGAACGAALTAAAFVLFT